MRTREGFFRWIVGHRRPVVGVSAVIVLAAGVVAGGVPIDHSFEQFFPTWGTERETYDRYKLSFSKEDAQFSLFWEDDREPGVALFEDMRSVARIFEDVGLQDVRWFGSVQVAGTELIDGESAIRLYSLQEERGLSDADVSSMLARHREDPLLLGSLWNADQSVFAIHGYLNAELATDEYRRSVEESLTRSLDSSTPDGVRSALVGIPVFRSRIPKLLERDQTMFLGGGFVVFFGLLFYFFRNVTQVGLCLASVVPGYLCTAALIGLTGRSISVLTSFIPIIVLVVGVSDAIHLLVGYRKRRRQLGDNDEAIVRTFSKLGRACFYTSITTAIGFVTLLGTQIGIVMEFGVFTAIAILLTFGFSMILLPALLGFCSNVSFSDRGLKSRWARTLVDAASWVARHKRPAALTAFAIIGATGLGLGSMLRVNTLLVDDMKESSPIIQDLRWVESKGFGLFQVNVMVRAEGNGELHEPDVVGWMADVEQFVRSEAVVESAVGLPDVLSGLREAVVDDETSSLPTSTQEASQLLLLAEFEGGEEVRDVYDREGGVAQVIALVRDEGSAQMLPFLERLDQYLDANPPPFGTAVSTGSVKLVQTFTALLLGSFVPSFVLALLLVTALMIRLFGSLRLGLIAVVPNLFPLLVIMGFMKVGGIDLKPSTILVFSIAFGIVVDDTMHFLSALEERLNEGLGMTEAVEGALRTSGPAILMTSVALGLGFSLLMASQFEVLFLVGLMTLVSVVAAVLADLYALPSLMIVLSRSDLGDSASPHA